MIQSQVYDSITRFITFHAFLSMNTYVFSQELLYNCNFSSSMCRKFRLPNPYRHH